MSAASLKMAMHRRRQPRGSGPSAVNASSWPEWVCKRRTTYLRRRLSPRRRRMPRPAAVYAHRMEGDAARSPTGDGRCRGLDRTCFCAARRDRSGSTWFHVHRSSAERGSASPSPMAHTGRRALHTAARGIDVVAGEVVRRLQTHSGPTASRSPPMVDPRGCLDDGMHFQRAADIPIRTSAATSYHGPHARTGTG